MKGGRIFKNTLTDWQPEYLRRPDPAELMPSGLSETY
jgi:hypothetical protein